MAWVDRQSPEGDEIFYDHIGYFVPDLEIAGTQLEKLGFQVSDINIQYNENAAGELHPTGTSNKLAKLNLGFIEVLAATSESALADQLKSMLARYQGLHVIALTNPDMDATARRLKEAGSGDARRGTYAPKSDGQRRRNPDGLHHSSRKPGTYTEGRLQILTNHTPENFWLPGDMDHENHADTLTDLLICVEDVEEAVTRYETFFGTTAVTMAAFGRWIWRAAGFISSRRIKRPPYSPDSHPGLTLHLRARTWQSDDVSHQGILRRCWYMSGNRR